VKKPLAFGYTLLALVCAALTACQGASTNSERDEQRAYERSVDATQEDIAYPSSGNPERMAEEAEATSRADYNEERERDSWASHLRELAALGENYAGDLSVNDDPAAVNCEGFDYQDEADAFFYGAGGPAVDLFVLDEDRDTMACELLPRWAPGADWRTNSRPP
jgi:hypothetical protein